MPTDVRREVWRTALAVAAIYAVFGICWIFFTDRLLALVLEDPADFALGQTFKGWIYVLLTAALAFSLWFHLHSRIEQGNTALRLGRFALDNAAISIFQIGEDGKIIYVNEHAAGQLGYERDDLCGMSLPQIDPKASPDWLGKQRKKASTGGSHRLRAEHLRKDGSRMPVEVQVSYFSFEGTFTSFSFVTDMTDRQKWEEGLVAAKEAAEAANRAKNDFLGIMSHEMRTPLNPIIGFSELLLEEAGDRPEEQESLKIIIQSAERMLRLVDHTLQFAKLDRHSITPLLTPVCLHQIMEETISHARGLIWHVPLRWTHQEPGLLDVPADLWVRADVSLIREALDHLIENAAKFTLHGEVVVSVAFASIFHRSPERMVRFTVRDTGIGIPPNRLREMFHPFTQLDTSSSRRYEGVGLGLAITAKLVALMGGKIQAESDPGKGSHFWFEIPLEMVPAGKIKDHTPDASSAPSMERHHGRVLLVEDRPDNVEVAQSVLRKAGLETLAAANGEEALRHLNGESFDLVLMDLSMPGMDGFETTNRIRCSGQPWANIPIVGLSAHPGSEVESKCRQAGMQAYYEKPIRPELFIRTVMQHLQTSPLKDISP